MPCEVIGRHMPKFLYFKYALWKLWLSPNFYTASMPYGQTYAQIFILKICHIGRLVPIFILQICLIGRLMAMPKFLYCKYAIWADLCPNFYTSNMPFWQTYAQIFTLQINMPCEVIGRLMTNFLYFKYALWADLWLCPNFYTANMPYGQTYALIFIL